MHSPHSWIRRSQRVIRMVSDLHRMGFQNLRFMPHEHPLAYRIAIAPKSQFSAKNGAFISSDQYPFDTCYSSASGSEYFGWADAASDDSRSLADKFVDRFGGLADQGRGSDWAYAGWVADLISVFETKPNRLPMVMAEYFEPDPLALRELPLRLYGERLGDDDGEDLWFPLPPPGSKGE